MVALDREDRQKRQQFTATIGPTVAEGRANGVGGPSDWHQADRTYAYGAPITRLALTSNALANAVMNPAALQRILDSTARRQGRPTEHGDGRPRPA